MCAERCICMDIHFTNIHKTEKKRHHIHPAPLENVDVEGNKSQEPGMSYFISLSRKKHSNGSRYVLSLFSLVHKIILTIRNKKI